MEESPEEKMGETLERHEIAVKRSLETVESLENQVIELGEEFEEEEVLDRLESLGVSLEEHENRLEKVVETLDEHKKVIEELQSEDISTEALKRAVKNARAQALQEDRPPSPDRKDV